MTTWHIFLFPKNLRNLYVKQIEKWATTLT